jgi:sulfoxide reductase catalytic subunit YedY
MLIRVTPPHAIKSSEITDESVYRDRRRFLREAAALGIGAAIAAPKAAEAMTRLAGRERLDGLVPAQGTVGAVTMGEDLRDDLTRWRDVTTYNNYYEFGTAKDDPAVNARNFRTKPWTVKVDGLVKQPADYQVDAFLRPHKLEDRIYRHRCVEAWSMVVPWRGFPLAEFIKRVEPLPSAKYVEFTTLNDPQQMPGLRYPVLDWPYVEGLRLDEAMHPLAMLATGVYGTDLPNHTGAPFRLGVPWTYGFKGGKSIVRIRFTEREPRTAWNVAAPQEYGFYANVNPSVDHPRWSQKRERVIGSIRTKTTLMFNGYADQVASLYAGMDLTRFY